MICRMLKVFEEIFRRHKIPHKIRCSNKCQYRPDENSNGFFDFVFRLAHIRFLLLVFNTFAQSQKFCFNQISVDNTENGLRTCPSAPCSSTHCCYGKNSQKEEHQQERHEVEFLHIKGYSHQFQFFMVKTEQENVIAVNCDPWQYQCNNSYRCIHPVTLDTVGNPPLQILFCFVFLWLCLFDFGCCFHLRYPFSLFFFFFCFIHLFKRADKHCIIYTRYLCRCCNFHPGTFNEFLDPS